MNDKPFRPTILNAKDADGVISVVLSQFDPEYYRGHDIEFDDDLAYMTCYYKDQTEYTYKMQVDDDEKQTLKDNDIIPMSFDEFKELVEKSPSSNEVEQ